MEELDLGVPRLLPAENLAVSIVVHGLQQVSVSVWEDDLATVEHQKDKSHTEKAWASGRLGGIQKRSCLRPGRNTQRVGGRGA